MATIRNGIISRTVLAENGEEPVTVQEVKDWLRMSYSTEDTLIEGLIKTARTYAESYCCISIIEKQIKVVFTHDGEKAIELPFGPNISITALNFRSCRLRDWSDVFTTTDWNYDGDFISNWTGYHEATYTAGYPDGEVPQGIKDAIKMICARLYEHRGDQKGFSLSIEEMDLLNPYTVRFWA